MSIKIVASAVVASLSFLTPLLPAQTPLPDPLGGERYLKLTQDVSIASAYLNQQRSYNVDVLTLGTANSFFNINVVSAQTIATSSTLSSTNNLPAQPPVAVKSGRMFNTSNDQFAALVPNSAWSFVYYNPPDSSANPPRSPVTKTLPIAGSQVGNANNTSGFVVMGNFRGDGLKQALGVFATSTDGSTYTTSMAVMGAQANGNNPSVTDSVMVGPLYSLPATATASGFISLNQNTVATGDFNGDGKDEIAMLMADQQTVRFFSVNASSYAVSPMSPASITLPQQVARGVLVPGRFTSPAQIDLVVVGVAEGSAGMLFPYISTQGQTAGTFNPQIKTPASLPQQPFNIGSDLYTFFASAAALIVPGANQNATFGPEQLVIASQNNTGGQGFWIGDFSLQPFAFTQLSYTDLGSNVFDYPSACPLGMQVGNYDNQDISGNYNPALQLALLSDPQGCNSLLSTPVISILNIIIPNNLPPSFGSGNWIQATGFVAPFAVSSPNGLAAPTTITLNAADIQGRSQQLGAPEIVTVPLQTQPEVVLPMPPMHADYIVPPDSSECTPGTQTGTSGPCVVGISYSPTTANSKIPAFANQFVSSTNSSQSTNNTATSSWGLSVKTSVGVKVSYNDLIESGSLSIKDSAKSTFDKKISNQTINGASFSAKVTAQTVTSDVIFFTQRDLFVYYYPVLGAKDSSGNPVYVNFSIPGNLHHFPAADATQYDWYQPVHETGNLLSYPWSLNQLEAGFANGLDVRTTQQFGCQSIGSVQTNFSTSWQNSSSSSQSVASAATFSNDLAVSESAGVGISGIDGASISASVNVNTSSSLGSLNVETSSMDAGEGVTDTSPGFPNLNQFNYYVAQYIFGQKTPANTTLWDQIPFNTSNPNQPNYFNQATTGPLFVGFVADVAPSNPDPNAVCSNSSSNPGWASAYTLPDIGLNHPDRWSWSTASSTVSFNYQNGTTSPSPATQSNSVDPFTSGFYPIKGFFVTTPNSANNGKVFGPNVTSAADGQPLQLSARVYNYSLKDTDDPSLAQKASKIHVDFYGQQACNDGSDVCPGTLFEIGEAVLAQPIPGYKSSRYVGQPNWALASVPFDTTGRAGQNLVFWVITWMEDFNGNRVQEMPGHGLKATPAQNLTNLLNPSQLSMELYSNNVGLYGAHTQFTITPPIGSSTASLASSGRKRASPATGTEGTLRNLKLLAPSKALLDDAVRLSARVRTTGGPVDNITITYWDGDPADGRLIDTQKIHHIDSNDAYLHVTNFKPRSCGVHNIQVEASTAKAAITSRAFPLDVTVDPLDLIDDMQDRLRAMNLRNTYKSPLLLNLRLAKTLLRQGQTRRGLLALRSFGQSADLTADAAGTGTRPRLAAMAGEAKIIDDCIKANR